MLRTKNLGGVSAVKPDWSAAPGSAAEILNKPSIPAAQVQSDWDETEGLGAILNKPTLVATDHTHSSLSNMANVGITVDTNGYASINKESLAFGSGTSGTHKAKLFSDADDVVFIYPYGTSGEGSIAIFSSGNAAGGPDHTKAHLRIYTTGAIFTVAVKSSSLEGSGNRALYADPSGYLTTSSSDERLKEQVEESTDHLDKIMALRPVKFKWKDKEKRGAGTEIGLLAHEVETVLPEIVGSNTADGMKTVDYAKICVTLTGALQEAMAIISDLQSRVEALEGAHA